MIKVTYYYSACVSITTPDVSILCDPWFTNGIYDGSWYLYPPVPDPMELVGKHDLIYVSHIHPDHYDPVFLKKYLREYPDTKIIMAEGVFLDKKMDADGIEYDVFDHVAYCALDTTGEWILGQRFHGKTILKIVKNDTGSISDIDTALVVKYKDHAVVNMNDNQYNKVQIETIKAFSPNIDIALFTA